mmetsp:Transcript_92415/g.298699  ORF Transcript_92415/g.298699 Transcript_92415/m.298699 type:complete len:223 (+) Transcript_92415:113-781(+)
MLAEPAGGQPVGHHVILRVSGTVGERADAEGPRGAESVEEPLRHHQGPRVFREGLPPHALLGRHTAHADAWRRGRFAAIQPYLRPPAGQPQPVRAAAPRPDFAAVQGQRQRRGPRPQRRLAPEPLQCARLPEGRLGADLGAELGGLRRGAHVAAVSEQPEDATHVARCRAQGVQGDDRLSKLAGPAAASICLDAQSSGLVEHVDQPERRSVDEGLQARLLRG